MDTDTIARVAESQILEAIEDGKFENLPGKGKPIVFEDDLSIPLEVRMANKVLKNSGAVPDWVQFRRDILEERKAVESALARLTKENMQRRERLLSLALEPNHPHMVCYSQWRRKSRDAYRSLIVSVNTAILKFCMTAPSAASVAEPFAPYKIEYEMSRFDEAFAPLAELPEAPTTSQKSEGVLRSSARMRYEATLRTRAGSGD